MQFNSELTEIDLVRAAQKDPRDFNELYERYVQPVYRYHYRRVNNVSDAEDLTAQTFMSALEALPHYRLDGHFPGWLFAIAHNKVIDFYRRARAHAQLHESAIPAEPSDFPEEVVHLERIDQLKQIVHNLDEDDKELIYLRYVAGLSFEDVSIAMHKNTEAVKKNVYRLIGRIRNEMEKDDE